MSDEALDRLLVVGGWARFAAMVVIVVMQVAPPDSDLRWPLAVGALVVFAIGAGADVLFRREHDRGWQ